MAEVPRQLQGEETGQPQQEGEGGPAAAALQSEERDGGGGDEGTVDVVGAPGEGATQEGPAEESRWTEEGAVTVAGGGGGVGFFGGGVLLPRVTVQGVDVPLDDPIIQLWGALRHPDHFLYVVVRKQGSV